MRLNGEQKVCIINIRLVDFFSLIISWFRWDLNNVSN